MDPRHPEQAISRMRELMKQYDRVEKDMGKATTSAQLAQLEREGGLVVQEICLVAPRIHEAMMQTSRQRRHDLSRGNIYERMREYAATAERVDEPVEKPVEKSQEKCEKETPKQPEKCDEADEPVEKVEELTFEQQHTKYTLGLDKELGANEEQKKRTTRKKKTTKKAEK